MSNYGTLVDRSNELDVEGEESVRRPQSVQPPRRGFSLCFYVSIGLSAIFILPLVTFLVAAGLPMSGCPWANPLCTVTSAPVHPRNLSGELFAVGFDLNAGYVTAAISFRNGTTIAVARCNGDDKYIDTMAKLSLNESAHPTPPYYNVGEFRDSGRQWLRLWKKIFGLPASPEVDAIANMLRSLKVPINDVLGNLGPMRYATITTPYPCYFGHIYNEDLVDAADQAGMEYLVPFKLGSNAMQWPVGALNAAYAGMDLGLYGDGIIPWDCDRESRDNPFYRPCFVLEVSFTEHALLAYISDLSPTSMGYWAKGHANFSLGRAALSAYPSPEHYWQEVALNIQKAMETTWVGGNLSRVVAHGDLAVNLDFQRVLNKTVLEGQMSGKAPPFFIRDPEFAGALGAAKLGLRCTCNGRWNNDGSQCGRWGNDGSQCFPELTPTPWNPWARP